MPLSLQVKLLRVLDNGRVLPLGSTTEIPVNIRLVSATNRNLEQMVNEGKFRTDLFYRLNVIPIVVPPLRERADDIPLLARHFVATHAARMGRHLPDIAPETMDALCRYGWPGNVRELENALERAVALGNSAALEVTDLPHKIGQYVSAPHEELTQLPPGGLDLEALVTDIETTLIQQALQRGKFSQKRAAELLGLTPRSFRYRLQKYGLESA
jgi:two-component system response regulator PilR (NtrC family)